jgi:hypothetical protein
MRRAILRIAAPLLMLGAFVLLANAAEPPKGTAGDGPLRVTYYYLPG